MSPTSMKLLIEDLVPLIIDSTDWSTASSSLLNFALVSPSWLWPIRRHLYKHPTIISENQCRYLVQTLESVPALKPLVCGVSLWLEEPPFAVEGLRAVRVVLSLQNLRSISFISATATFLIQRIPDPALIKELHFLPYNDSLPRPTPLSRRLHTIKWGPSQASKFTALTKLVFSGSNLHIIPPSFAPHVQYPPNLTHITLSRYTVPSRHLQNLFDPLGWSRVHTLVLILLREEDSLIFILSLCATSLVRLHLQYGASRSTGPVATAFFASRIFDAFHAPGALQLQSLRTLRLIDVGPQRQRDRALRNIALRCPGLAHLTISGHLAVHMLCEWGWPEDVAMAFPALEEMAGPAQVVAPNGLLVSSKAYWETQSQGRRWTVYADEEW